MPRVTACNQEEIVLGEHALLVIADTIRSNPVRSRRCMFSIVNGLIEPRVDCPKQHLPNIPVRGFRVNDVSGKIQ